MSSATRSRGYVLRTQHMWKKFGEWVPKQQLTQDEAEWMAFDMTARFGVTYEAYRCWCKSWHVGRKATMGPKVYYWRHTEVTDELEVGTRVISHLRDENSLRLPSSRRAGHIIGRCRAGKWRAAKKSLSPEEFLAYARERGATRR